jgi:rSAM/selenodomain-associated transferase 1
VSESVVCLVFAKPPRHGGAKSRLAAGVGAERASSLAEAFLRDTWSLVAATTGLSPVLATTDPTADHGLPAGIERWDQGDGDLGRRLERMVRKALVRSSGVLAIGADAPGLPSDLLALARDAVSTHDAVLGRAEDGGFWTIGLRACPSGLFDGLPWSTETTADATAARLTSLGLAVHEVGGWWDIDTPADLDRFRREIPVARAPFTHAALSARP